MNLAPFKSLRDIAFSFKNDKSPYILNIIEPS